MNQTYPTGTVSRDLDVYYEVHYYPIQDEHHVTGVEYNRGLLPGYRYGG